LSTDRKIMRIPTTAKGVYLMKFISPARTATSPTRFVLCKTVV
jgi:hypothetical protein